MLRHNQRRVLAAKQDIFQHRGIGEQDVRRLLAELLSGGNGVREATACFPSLFITLNAANHIDLALNFLVVSVGRFQFLLGEVTIVNRISQIRPCQQFLQSLFLVLHQGVEGIKEDGLNLIDRQGAVGLQKVIDKRHHEALGFTRAGAGGDNYRLILLKQRLPALILMLIRGIAFSPQSSDYSLGLVYAD